MRSIILSTIIAVLALLPVALVLGTGRPLQTPLAAATLCGPLLAVTLVLVFERKTGVPPGAAVGRKSAEPAPGGEARDLLRDETVWQGLTGAEAERRLSRYGVVSENGSRSTLSRFVAVVPMLGQQAHNGRRMNPEQAGSIRPGFLS